MPFFLLSPSFLAQSYRFHDWALMTSSVDAAFAFGSIRVGDFSIVQELGTALTFRNGLRS
jgi:hypothetical protein